MYYDPTGYMGNPCKKDNISEVGNEEPKTNKDKNANSKAETLANNREVGREFEQKKLPEFQTVADNVVEQVTIKTSQGTKIRVDAIGIDKITGEIVIQEYKSSLAAPLTKNQTKGFPELQSSGGTVVGNGKGIFTGGTVIPPTKVEVIRPN
jgi:hypothetical protein